MTRQNTSYVYGSAARQTAPRPSYNSEEEIRRRQRERQNYRRRQRRQPKPKLDKVSLLLTMITFAAVMVVGIFYIRLQFQSTYLSKSVVKLQSEVVELEKENATSEMELENSVNLREVYKKATKELGMREATSDQIFTYESKKSTQI